MTELLKAVGLTAGLGGLALGVFLLLFQRIDLPKATRRHLTLFMWLVWSICVLGMAVYYMSISNRGVAIESTTTGEPSSAVGEQALSHFSIELYCGQVPPDEHSELARLFDYAERNQGKLASFDIEYFHNDCRCDQIREPSPIITLEPMCELNPSWWLSGRMGDYHCLGAIGLAGYSAGVGTICFPRYSSLPLRVGFTRRFTATTERVTGAFLLNWEWSLGAPHVQLLLEES